MTQAGKRFIPGSITTDLTESPAPIAFISVEKITGLTAVADGYGEVKALHNNHRMPQSSQANGVGKGSLISRADMTYRPSVLFNQRQQLIEDGVIAVLMFHGLNLATL